MSANVPIDIELSGALSAAAAEHEELGRRLSARLDPKLPCFGVPGRVMPKVSTYAGRRLLRVRVNGRVQPYPLGLLARSWQCVAPQGEHGVPYEQAGGDDAAADDRWIAGAEGEAAALDPSAAIDFVVEAVIQVVMRRPQALLGDSQFAAYRADLGSNGRRPRDYYETMQLVAHFLLGLGVSVARREEVAASVQTLLEAGLEGYDVAEVAFERLRSRAVQIHCQPSYLVSIAGGDPIEEDVSVYDEHFHERGRAAFERLGRLLFDELGLRAPDICWKPDARLRPSTVSIQINDRVSPPVRAPAANKLHVDAPIDEVQAIAGGIEAEPFYDVTRRRQVTLVPEAAREQLAGNHLEFRTPVEWIAVAVQHELRSHAGDMLGADDVEYHLARLDEQHPDLVAALLGTLPLGDMTRILRALVRERHSIKDLLTIVERLLLYEEVTVENLHDVVFDPRFPVTSAMKARPTKWVRQFEFVRSGVAPLAVKRNRRGLDALEVIRIDSELEQRAKKVAYQPPGTLRSWLNDDEQAELCDGVRQAIERAGLESAPVVLTARWARGGIREVVATEFPDVAVLAHEDLLPGTAPETLATVAIG